MVSNSNCCDPGTVHLFLRKPDGTFAARQEVELDYPNIKPYDKLLWRGHSRPRLLDWNRDGHTDLVVSGPEGWQFHVSAGPLAGKSAVAVKPFALPEIPGVRPYFAEFTDWDGDGRFDLLLASQLQETKEGPWVYAIHWCRNTSARGEPKFEPPVRLLTIPTPWEVNGFAVVPRDRSGRPGIVVSVTKDWKRKPDFGWNVESQLWLYRWNP